METKVIVATTLEIKAIVAEAVSIAFKYADFNTEPPLSEERTYTRKQSADFLQISEPTLDEYTKRGIIDCRFIGSEKRYLTSDLLAALRKPEIKRVQVRKNKKA